MKKAKRSFGCAAPEHKKMTPALSLCYKCRKAKDFQVIDGCVLGVVGFQNMYLLTEWKDQMGKYLARGHGIRTELREVRAP